MSLEGSVEDRSPCAPSAPRPQVDALLEPQLLEMSGIAALELTPS